MNSNAKEPIIWSVSDFVAVINQTLDFAFPFQKIIGEIANLKISRNRWVYFDIKDENSSVRCFGSIFSLNTVVEDGMMVVIGGCPRLHPKFGFSVNFETIQPAGEGSIKRASSLLEAKLRKEGLFEDTRKRPLPYPPKSIGLITSMESAAYHDFIKILSNRWCGITIEVFDVKVQGEQAAEQIAKAIAFFNISSAAEVLVITRGGGSKDDFSAFDSELLVRAVAGSRLPTVIAIGHEIDVSLSELAADRRASTPSNAAELLTPDKAQTLDLLAHYNDNFCSLIDSRFLGEREFLEASKLNLITGLTTKLESAKEILTHASKLLNSMHPDSVLKRGYTIIKQNGLSVGKISDLTANSSAEIIFQDGIATAQIIKPDVR